MDYFQARITYSPEYAGDGKEFTTTEGFQDMTFLTHYLEVMGSRITKYEILERTN